MRLWLPIKTVSCSNVRENRFVRAKRTKAERETARLIVRDIVRDASMQKLREVKMVRHGNRLLDPGNLPVSMKGVQDGLCDALGIDDGPWQKTGIRWEYDQKQVKRESTGVMVELRFAAEVV